LEDAGGFSVLLPELFGNLGDSIDSDTVEVVVFYELSDPILEVLPDE
jgi:hypothetical protein